jgi:tyrosine-protein kinase Etk/Wzc
VIDRSRSESSAPRMAEGEINVLGYLALMWRYRTLILSACAAVTLATAVVTLITPKVYESTASLLVPKESSGSSFLAGLQASAMLQQFGGLAGTSMTPNRDMLMSILKSRTMAQALVERFNLQQRYRKRYVEDTIRELQSAVVISVSKEGVISIRVEDTDAQVAAQMANYYVEQLDRIVSQLDVGEAGQRRVFLTARLAHAKADLDVAEQTLRRFQEQNRAVALQEQTRGAIEAAARIKGEIMASEVQIQVMRNFATDANPEVVALRRRVDEMKRQLAQMQYGDGIPAAGGAGQDRRDYVVSLPKVPEIALEFARLTRDVKIQETVVGLLTQQLEQAKIAEANTLPVVRVLDRATAAERPSKPRLRLNLAVAAASSLFAATVLAFALDFFRGPGYRGRPEPVSVSDR